MFNMKFFFTAFLIALASMTVDAQKVNLVSGNLDFLKGVKKVTLDFDYSTMAVGKYKDGNEYVATKKADYNKKEEGKGDQWEQAWLDDRSNRFEPRFEEALISYCPKIDFDQNSKSDYTMIVATTFTEPGFNIGVTRKSASIDLEVRFVDNAGAEKAKLTIKRVPGRDVFGYDFDTGYRIEEAYGRAGKNIANFIEKSVF